MARTFYELPGYLGGVIDEGAGTNTFDLPGYIASFRALPAAAGTWKSTAGLVSGSTKTVLGLARASIKTFQGLTP